MEKLERKHSKFKERLSQKRNRKWQNLKEKNLKGLEHLLLAERKSSKNFVNGALKNVKERKIEEKNEVLDVSKDLDMMRFGKKELDEKFIIGKRKYRNINCAIETNKEECENLRTSSQKVKSPLPLSYAEVTKAGQMKKEVNFSELYLNLLETNLEWKPPDQRSVPIPQSVKIHLFHWLCLTKLNFFLLMIENLFPL